MRQHEGAPLGPSSRLDSTLRHGTKRLSVRIVSRETLVSGSGKREGVNVSTEAPVVQRELIRAPQFDFRDGSFRLSRRTAADHIARSVVRVSAPPPLAESFAVQQRTGAAPRPPLDVPAPLPWALRSTSAPNAPWGRCRASSGSLNLLWHPRMMVEGFHVKQRGAGTPRSGEVPAPEPKQ